MAVEALKEFTQYVEDTAPVADVSPGGYSLEPEPNLVYLGNTTGQTISARMTAGPLDEIVVNGVFSSDTGWTKGTGWTIAAGVATHASGTAGILSQTYTAAVLADARGWLTFTVSNRTTGGVTPVVGGTSGSPRSTNATFIESIEVGSSNLDLGFSASSTFDGNIDDVTLWMYFANPSPGHWEQNVANGGFLLLGEGRLWLPYISVWVPAAGTVTNVNLMGRHATPLR